MQIDLLGQKRLEAVLAIAGYAAGGGAISGVPCFDMGVSKQIAITTSDILMYASIWKIYFEETLSQQALRDLLLELGLVTIAAAGTAYVAANGSSLVLRQIAGWTGPIGWLSSGLVSGSLAGALGLAWMLYCDRRFQEMRPEFAGAC